MLENLSRLKSDPQLCDPIFGSVNPLVTSISRLESQVAAMMANIDQLRNFWPPGKSKSPNTMPSVPPPPPPSMSALTTALRSRVVSGDAKGSALTELHKQNSHLVTVVAQLNEEKRVLEKRLKIDGETQRPERSKESIEELQAQLSREREAHQLQMQQLETERSQILQGLSDARKDEEVQARKVLDLQNELEAAVTILEETRKEKEKALQTQAELAEKTLRDRMAEANGDQAVLEHQNASLNKELEQLRLVHSKLNDEKQANDARHGRELNGLKAEMHLTKAELREMQRKLSEERDSLVQAQDKAGLARAEKERQETFSKEAIQIASAFHECVSRLHTAIKSSATISGSVTGLESETRSSTMDPDMSLVETSQTSTPNDLDYLQTELQTLKAYDLTAFSDSVTRTMSLVKKWQKSCKQYRERSKNQIAFAQFAKGDLALFLPTRNAIARSWAAFNIASPHYFLKPTPNIEKMMAEREWIVARIVSVTEGLVDSARFPNNRENNPYDLAEGIKYHELQADVYVPTPAKPRRSASSGHTLETSRSPLSLKHRAVSTPIPLRETSPGAFPPLLDATGRPITEREAGLVPGPAEGPRSMHTTGPSALEAAIHAPLKGARRPSSVASSSASSHKFRKGIQIGTGGSGKAGSVVGVTKDVDGQVERISSRQSLSAGDYLSAKRGVEGQPDVTTPASISLPKSPGLWGGNELPRSLSPGSSPLGLSGGKYARMAGKRSITEPKSRLSVGEGALDILKRFGENQPESGHSGRRFT